MKKELELSADEWRLMLGEARGRLSQIRVNLIVAWLNIFLADTREDKIKWGKDWGEAVKEEVALTEDVIAPAKIELGLPITNRNQEGKVIRRTGRIAEEYGGTFEQGRDIINRHIRLTKKIQKRLGV